jgi:hypothetical protein
MKNTGVKRGLKQTTQYKLKKNTIYKRNKYPIKKEKLF